MLGFFILHSCKYDAWGSSVAVLWVLRYNDRGSALLQYYDRDSFYSCSAMIGGLQLEYDDKDSAVLQYSFYSCSMMLDFLQCCRTIIGILQ